MANFQSDQASNKDPSLAFQGRAFFDQLQRQSPNIPMPDLDPDPPVRLDSNLRKFDLPIMNLLNKILPASQSKAPSGLPLALPAKGVPKATCLAKKLASGHSDLTKGELDNLADRIGWLLRNWFRRDARDGYEKCLKGGAPRSKKSALSAAKTQATTLQADRKTAVPPQPSTPQGRLSQPLIQATNPNVPAPSSGIPDGQFQGAGEGVNPAHLEPFGTQEQHVPLPPNLVEIAPADEDDFSLEVSSMDGPEPPRDCRRPVSSNYAAMGVSSSMA